MLQADTLPILIVSAFTALLAWRMFSFTSEYAVNLPYMDHWDFYQPLFDHAGVLRMFTWQHGPHRQGLGMLVIAALASATRWNIRADAFAVAGAICAATVLALIVKRRLFGRLTYTDLFIPAVLLTMRQWESLVSVPNISHSALPLALLMLFSLAWLIHDPRWRWTTLLALNFLTLFTGFGFFLGDLTPILVLIEIVHQIKRPPLRHMRGWLIALVISLLSLASFYVNYTFEPAVPGFRFPHPQFYLYPHMMALLLANGAGFVSTGPFASIIGWTLLLCALLVISVHVRALISKMPQDEPSRSCRFVIVSLIAFSLLFAAGMAVGRISLGVAMSTVSRYVTLVLPALIGLYVHLLTLRPAPWRTVTLFASTALLVLFSLQLRAGEQRNMFTYYHTKTRWRDVYLQTHDINLAARAVGTVIHPDPQKTHLKQKLDYLEKHHLSFFAQ